MKMYRLLNPFDPTENDIFLAHVKREVQKLFDRGVPAWEDRQSPEIDRILSGIVTRTRDPIDTVEKLDAYVAEQYEKHKHIFALEHMSTTGAHKFINKWTSEAFERLCLEHQRITREENKKHPDTDFWIDEQLPIDLKVTTYPQKMKPGELRMKENLNRESAGKLIERYYRGQGIHRWNWQNRLFIVCYDADKGEHLRLKIDFDRMREVITNYFDRFVIGQMYHVCQLKVNGKVRDTNYYGRPVQPVALADVIWNYRERPFLAQIRPTVGPFGPTEQLGLF